ncbi:hypothetical protein DL89DRAFT_135807 [Linderina pennispora]|uniref:Roadblock/LAMTOR2 domain-containing protein n=1 Tax=Linderina pennispora TaxID=61395 RepID=A0A1Y1WBB1_9FUNG|nr:uncharacterized protein DL89DRAFT_135807 [Linderina pennispora]ORX70536.1 hypothetical protein DL89DRAFT_135807 [Linderina pennispora]
MQAEPQEQHHQQQQPAYTNGEDDPTENQFEKLLEDAIDHIDGLMLVRITDADRENVFRAATPVFHEPYFEDSLIEKCYDAFDDINKLHIGASQVLTLIYSEMQLVQFRVGLYYGTIVCDMCANMGMVHSLVARIRACLKVLSDMTKDMHEE